MARPGPSLPVVAFFVALAGMTGLSAARVLGGERDTLPRPDEALPGRATRMPLPERHFVYGTRLDIAPAGSETAYFAMGCFWGAEQYFFNVPGVLSTAVGYAGGLTPNPTYDEVSTGRTGHTEVVRVVFDPNRVTYEKLLKVFWENHVPTQGMRQGNDFGTQYRSAIYTVGAMQELAATASRETYGAALRAVDKGTITTEIRPAGLFYFAEGYHQQYCAKNPDGYCGHGGTGVPYTSGR